MNCNVKYVSNVHPKPAIFYTQYINKVALTEVLRNISINTAQLTGICYDLR